MKTAVIYRTMTGHSKKIANAVAAALGTEALNIKDNPALVDIDLLFIAGGIYSGASLPETIEFVKTLDSSQVKKAALITSSMSDKVGQDEVRKLLEAGGIKVLDEYRCRGNFLFLKMGHPNKQEKEGAVRFAKELAARIGL